MGYGSSNVYVNPLGLNFLAVLDLMEMSVR